MQAQAKTKKSEMTVRTFFIDGTPNYLRIKQNDKLIQVFLKLESEKKLRFIGTVTKSTKTIEVKREREKHLFLKLNAYGFNRYVISNQTSFDWIRLNDEFCHWKIPVKYILENGKYLHFKSPENGGYELQQFVSLEELEQFRVHEHENRRF